MQGADQRLIRRGRSPLTVSRAVSTGRSVAPTPKRAVRPLSVPPGSWRRRCGPGRSRCPAKLLRCASSRLRDGFVHRCSIRQELLHPFDEAFHAEGLVEIAVDAQAFGPGLVTFAGVSGDHDDQRSLALLPGRTLELLEHEEAATLGKHRVQDHEVRVELRRLLDRQVAVAHRLDARAGTVPTAKTRRRPRGPSPSATSPAPRRLQC